MHIRGKEKEVNQNIKFYSGIKIITYERNACKMTPSEMNCCIGSFPKVAGITKCLSPPLERTRCAKGCTNTEQLNDLSQKACKKKKKKKKKTTTYKWMLADGE